jgi:hypothetical protein
VPAGSHKIGRSRRASGPVTRSEGLESVGRAPVLDRRSRHLGPIGQRIGLVGDVDRRPGVREDNVALGSRFVAGDDRLEIRGVRLGIPTGDGLDRYPI